MRKHRLSNENFINLQKELFQLEDHQIKVHADFILLDIESWLNAHFELRPAERLDLRTMDHERKRLFSLDISFAIVNRLPITLTSSGNSKNWLHRKRAYLLSEVAINWGPVLKM